MAIKNDIELQVIKSILKLMQNKPFYGHIVQQLSKVYVPKGHDVKTAAIGKNTNEKTLKLYINENYVDSLLKESKNGKEYIVSMIEHEILHCFPAGTMVGGSFLPIEKIHKGNDIISSSGNLVKVEKVEKRKYSGGLVGIRAQGLLSFEVTDFHRILVANIDRKTINQKSRHNVRRIKNIGWKDSQDVKKGDWLAIPRLKPNREDVNINIQKYYRGNEWNLPKTIQNEFFPLNEETTWLMGLYCAEGSSSEKSGQITLSIHQKEKQEYGEKVKNIISKYNIGGNVSIVDIKDSNGAVILFNSQILARMFTEKIGHLAINKKIPEEIFWNKDDFLIRGFLRGYFDGDGCLYKGGLQAATVSKVLSQQIQALLSRYGFFMNIFFDKCSEKEPYTIGKGKKLSVFKDQYRMMTSDNLIFSFLGYPYKRKVSPTKPSVVTEDFIFAKVTKTTRNENWKGSVYNLRSPTRDYTVNNAVVHNCVFGHLFIDFSDPTRGNVACDLCVNQYINPVHHQWMTVSRYGLPAGKSCYWYYDNLKSNKGYQEDVQKGVFGTNGLFSYLKDAHSKWKGAKEDSSTQDVIKDMIRKAKDSTQNFGDIHQDIKDFLGEYLQFKKPIVNWNRILRIFVAKSSETNLGQTIMRISKRYGTRPGNRQEEILNIAVSIDTSGSISEQDLLEFFTEIKAIYKNGARITIIEADCEVCRTYQFNGNFLGEVHGRGGTDLEPALKYADENGFDAHIYFTDFYAPKINKKYRTPILWVLTTEMDEDQYPYQWGIKVNLRDGRAV